MHRKPLHILLVAGSAEYPSRVRAALTVLENALQKRGATTYLWDLHDEPLPLFDPCYYMNPFAHPVESVRRFAQIAKQANAQVWGSPVYHNSFSGVLKNALDTLSVPHLQHKPIALLSSGSNDRTGSQPCDQLRIVARGLHAVPIPTQVVTLPTDFVRPSEHHLLANPQIQDRLHAMADELIMYAEMFFPLQHHADELELSQIPSTSPAGSLPASS